MKIYIPNNYKPERKYIIDVLLQSFLGLEYYLEEQVQCSDTIIELNNGNQLIIKDYFFNKYPESFLKEEAIPKRIEFLEKSSYIVDQNLPIIFGHKLIEKKTEALKEQIICHIDLFASSFFMLSRWEEYVLDNRDMHHRFPSVASLAFKNGFLSRPVVNEYLECIWKMLCDLGINQSRKERTFNILLSHDVDIPLKWNNILQFSRELTGDIVKRRNVKRALQTVNSYCNSKVNIDKDPFNTYDYLMDMSEKYNTKSHFFFISGGNSMYDNQHAMDSPFMMRLYERIQERGHMIGFHPSYNTYNNKEQWEKEYDHFKEACRYAQACGRQHYLRFEVPTTWQIWEDFGMSWDSTMGYADQIGFRCGTCYNFQVFNIVTRKRLNLVEKPLIVMEVTLPFWDEIRTLGDCKNMVIDLIEKIKRYDGCFNFLWHNSSFNVDRWQECQSVYEDILRVT